MVAANVTDFIGEIIANTKVSEWEKYCKYLWFTLAVCYYEPVRMEKNVISERIFLYFYDLDDCADASDCGGEQHGSCHDIQATSAPR